MRAWLWNLAGSWTFRLGHALHTAGLALCGVAGALDARADNAGYWTPKRSERIARRSAPDFRA